jgi:hypothetical protein
MFNTLVTNKINSSVTLSPAAISRVADSSYAADNKVLNHQYVISNLVKSSKLTSHYLNPSDNLVTLANVEGRSGAGSYKDISVLSTDSDVLGYDNLELLVNLSSSINNAAYKFPYFNLAAYGAQRSELELTFQPTLNESRPLTLTSNSLSNNFLLRDLYLTTHLL